MTALGHGAAVVIAGPIAADAFIDVVQRHRITHMAAIPVHLQLLEPALRDEGRPGPAIAELTVAGAVMPEALRGLIRRRLTPHLHVKYGSNEVGYLTAASPELQSRFPETIGCAVPGVEVEIVDDRDRALPAGEIGYLRARGERFPTEYIRNPEASARAFRSGCFYPGDLASRDSRGAFFFKGRADDLMNFDGVKIVPTDIEMALLQHPSVVEAAAFPLPSELHQDLPAVAVVLRQATTAEELLAFCRERLGVRTPRIIGIFPALPRNATGKILKRELARWVAEGHR
jgi:long-chain acyl-CoA synthetase